MPLRYPRYLALLGVLLLAACDSSPTEPDPEPEPPPEPELTPGVIQLTEVVSGLGGLTTLTAPPNDPRLFVVEQEGRIRVVEDGALLSTPFLDISGLVSTQGEQGLLGLAFHPDYADNGRFFVDYTDVAGDTRIVEYRVRADDPNRADPDSDAELLRIQQPGAAHNGGHIEFGPDGMLFVAMGDGGGEYDPHGNAQNVQTLLGGLLRLDVSEPGVAGIPQDNPFAGSPDDGAELLWAWGLRNPWKFSIDAESGLLFIGDVGQHDWEEVNVAPASEAGLNYGYPIVEGPDCVESGECDRDGFVGPAVYYAHSDATTACSVIGGAVYRGGRIPAADGHYFYSDLCQRFLRSFRYEDGEVVEHIDWDLRASSSVSAMGRDAAGDLYVLTVGGHVFRVDAAAGS